jgi:hypothetical protein
VVDLDDVAVVGIYDDATGAQCTGALIAPDLVLTAQHCVAALGGPLDCPTTEFGPVGDPGTFFVTTEPTFTFEPSDYHAVAEIRIPPGDLVCGRDIAVLVLAAPIAAAEAEPIAVRLDVPVAPGELYAAVGYGAIDSDGTDAGQRRRRDGLVADCVGAACTPSGDAAEWRGEAGICQGDSGGPALDADGAVIGVVSRASFSCMDPIYASLVAHADWLGPQLPGPEPTPDAGPDASADPDAALDADAAPDAALDEPPSSGGCCDASGSASASWLSTLLAAVALIARRDRIRHVL